MTNDDDFKVQAWITEALSPLYERIATLEARLDAMAEPPPPPPYKFTDGQVHLCWACGALPCDGGLQSWATLPWIVTMKESGGWRFLIDSRHPENPDMFSGFYLCANGKLGSAMQRYNYHRSYFIEDLPQ